MTGVPSIVMGLFIYTIYTLVFGLNGFGGSLALACATPPIISSSARPRRCSASSPTSCATASYVWGNRKWRT